MTEAEIQVYLDENGYPPHIVQAGSRGLVERWRGFVAEVERGYEYNLHNYRNDLDVRGLLRLFGLDDEVREADQRFDDVLTGREVRVWESAPGDPFWDFGYPRNVSGSLLRDLRREELIAAPGKAAAAGA